MRVGDIVAGYIYRDQGIAHGVLIRELIPGDWMVRVVYVNPWFNRVATEQDHFAQYRLRVIKDPSRIRNKRLIPELLRLSAEVS